MSHVLYVALMSIGILLTDATEISNAIITAIGSLGFPIVACIFLFRQNEKLEQRHEQESQKFTEAISGLTIAVEKLITLISGKE